MQDYYDGSGSYNEDFMCGFEDKNNRYYSGSSHLAVGVAAITLASLYM